MLLDDFRSAACNMRTAARWFSAVSTPSAVRKYCTRALGTRHIGMRDPGHVAATRSQNRWRPTRVLRSPSTSAVSMAGAMSDGSHIHIRRQRRDCASRISGRSRYDRGLGVSAAHQTPIGECGIARGGMSVPHRMVVNKWILSTGTANAVAEACSVKRMNLVSLDHAAMFWCRGIRSVSKLVGTVAVLCVTCVE